MGNIISLKKFTEESAISTKLRRYIELKNMQKEFNAIKKDLKTFFEGRDSEVVGDYIVTGKIVIKKSFTMPEAIYWDMRVNLI